MGLVYLARQDQPVKREVALKVVKGTASKEVLLRFQAEYQALAKLSYKNIVQIYDSGVDHHGSPYFSMEYFRGMPIHRYCERRHLPLRQRIHLLIQVCEGLRHAHQRGIIHRDIKPSNILVGDVQDKPLVKIIDFGLAKTFSGSLTDESLYTRQGQILGTPAFRCFTLGERGPIRLPIPNTSRRASCVTRWQRR